jgi:hypothetical protein
VKVVLKYEKMGTGAISCPDAKFLPLNNILFLSQLVLELSDFNHLGLVWQAGFRVDSSVFSRAY